MTSLIRSGEEFPVSTTLVGDQTRPAVAALSNGRFVVAWNDDSETGPDGSGSAVRAQIFNPDGSVFGDQFLVNGSKSGSQVHPTVAALSGGRFVIAWQDNGENAGDKSGPAVRAQVFGADGNKSGGEFLVNSTTDQDQSVPSITALSGGRFVVAWMDFSQSPDDDWGEAVRAQIYRADGEKFGGEFLVNSETRMGQGFPATAALVNGGFVVVWADSSETGDDTSQEGIRAQRFDADGNRLGNEFQVNATTAKAQFSPEVATLADGRFVVAWTDRSETGGDKSGAAIRAQIFKANGARDGGEFLVNSTTHDDQIEAAITALADGRFVIAWKDLSKDSNAAVRAQAFDVDGGKSGEEFLVSAVSVNFQEGSTLAGLPDGRLIALWADRGRGTNSDIRGQLFDVPRIGSKNGDTIEGDKTGDVILGEAGNDELSGGAGADRLDGGSGGDKLDGGSGADSLDGGAGGDRVVGGGGGDTLAGGAGRDQLTGDVPTTGHAGKAAVAKSGGSDVFLFAELGKTHFDRIMDFRPREDQIALDRDVFKGIGARLDKGEFKVGAKATDGNDRVIYDRENARLYFDNDGKGGTGQKIFAELKTAVKLTAADFDMI